MPVNMLGWSHRFHAVAILFAVFLGSLLPFCASAESPPRVLPKIIGMIPHWSEGYTQGLVFHRERLYEGTGLRGHSAIFAIEPRTWKILKEAVLERFFGEGIAIFQEKLYQLTWKAGKAVVYSVPDLHPLKTLAYKGEGWGLTSDSKTFIMSDGSAFLTFRDPDFRIRRRLKISLDGEAVNRINELEYAQGLVFANIWYEESILAISPETGKVSHIIDCSSLVEIESPRKKDHVLNGIAFNPYTETFFLTGKKWRFIFEVELSLP